MRNNLAKTPQKLISFWHQKGWLPLFFCGIGGALLASCLFILASVLEDDLIALTREEERQRDQRQHFLRAQEAEHLYQSMRRQAHQEGFDQPALSKMAGQNFIKDLGKRHNLGEIKIKPGRRLIKEGILSQPYTLFYEASLDVDVFAFMRSLSTKVRGKVGYRFLSLFREPDGKITGELRFEILNTSEKEGLS